MGNGIVDGFDVGISTAELCPDCDTSFAFLETQKDDERLTIHSSELRSSVRTAKR